MVRLLWTGGWDSTFRLLQLLQDTEATVQPLYLVDENRASTTREIDVMRKIRHQIEQQMPRAAGRLLPTDYGSFRATEIEPQYEEAWEQLQERIRVGIQYPVLASYAEQRDLGGLELSILAHGEIGKTLAPMVETQATSGGSVSALPDDVTGPEHLFSRFYFPLLDYTKPQMREEVGRRGIQSLMKLTHFCFNPTFGLPCGKCRPCEIAQKEGMGDRVGTLGPLLARTKPVLSCLLPTKIRRYISRNVST